VRLHIGLSGARLRAPFVSAEGSVTQRMLVLVRLEGADGVIGFGEAAPLGFPTEDVVSALEDCREALAESDGHDRDEVLAACWDLAVMPEAVAAVDLALWDLAGRRAGAPVWQLLGAGTSPPVEVNATIAGPDRAGASAEAAAALHDGFRALKVKVGIGDDAGRLAAIRAVAGSEVAIRVDANGAWLPADALAALRALEPVGIELCEEPVSGLEQIAGVSAQAPLPVAIDETTRVPGALDARACDSVCLKIASSGGISALIDAARRARAVGYKVYLASMLDGPLGIAAALHAAAVVRPDRFCGLATLGLFDDPEDPLPPVAGRMAAPSGIGLADGVLGWYRGAVG
jgi:L-Ala-D/L-Glu epimerase